jgi:hypothetical protein
MTIDEMWDRLAAHQPYADQRGYGKEWQALCKYRTQQSAQALGDFLWSNKHPMAAWAAWSAGFALRDISQAEMWVTKAEGETK